MGLADRFSENSFIAYQEKADSPAPSRMSNPFQLENTIVDKKPSFDRLKDELFEKIVAIPCWFEYDSKTQHDLIVKFLGKKNIKTPEGLAKNLQNSILGFGVFDEFLLKNSVSSIYYVEGEPLLYTEDDKNLVDTEILPSAKVRLAVRNIINMSQDRDKNGVYDFRIANYWVQLRTVPHTKLKLSISRITEKFLADEIDKNNLTLLLSDI